MKALLRSMETEATVGHDLLIHTSAKPGLPRDCSKNDPTLTKEILI